MMTLPWFVGDTDPLLARVPGTDLHRHGTLWLLTQDETRNSKRARLFTESYPAGSPHTCRFSRDCPLLAMDSSVRNIIQQCERASQVSDARSIASRASPEDQS